MDVKERADRITNEIVRVGGERKLINLLDDERKLWDLQSLVISFYRDSGLLHKAILEAHTTVEEEQSWYAYDREYHQRRDLAGVEFAETLVAPYLTQAQKGDLKNATLLAKIWAQYDPGRWGPSDKKDEDAGLRELELMRAFNEEWRKGQELEKRLRELTGETLEEFSSSMETAEDLDLWLLAKAQEDDDRNST